MIDGSQSLVPGQYVWIRAASSPDRKLNQKADGTTAHVGSPRLVGGVRVHGYLGEDAMDDLRRLRFAYSRKARC